MGETVYRLIEIEGGGMIHETGDAVIAGPVSEDHTLQVLFPADDIPNLIFLLTRIQADNVSGKGVRGSLEYTLRIDSAEAFPGPGSESISLVFDLANGTPVSFSLDRRTAETLRDGLNLLLK